SQKQMIELTRNGISPGYQKEDRYFSTYMNGYIYTVTREMAHMYKINPDSTKILYDYGSIYHPDIYTSKIPTNIVNDGEFIYGCIGLRTQVDQIKPYLYYFDPANISNPYGGTVINDYSFNPFGDADIIEDNNTRYKSKY